jgi:hypothetical protein
MVSFGYGFVRIWRRLGPAFLFGAIGRNRMRQENASAQQNENSCSKVDHRAHRVWPGPTGISRTWAALTSERLVRYLIERSRHARLRVSLIE